MKNKTILLVLFAISATRCVTENPTGSRNTSVPNGDFEIWDGYNLQGWNSNSCPFCTPAILTWLLRPSDYAHSGKYSAELLYNDVYPTYIQNKFPVSLHPISLNGYIKTNLVKGDTVLVQIKLLNNHKVVDSGKWEGTTALSYYTQIMIPITKTSLKVDSAVVYIRGGQKNTGAWTTSTILWVDDLTLNY